MTTSRGDWEGPVGEAYLARMDPESREAARTQQVRCKLCQVELTTDSFASQMQTQHNVQCCYLGKTVCTVALRRFEAQYVPAKGTWRYSVPNCSQGQEGKRYCTEVNMWSYFSHRNPQDTVRNGGLCPPPHPTPPHPHPTKCICAGCRLRPLAPCGPSRTSAGSSRPSCGGRIWRKRW